LPTAQNLRSAFRRGRSRSKAEGELTLDLKSGEEPRVYTVKCGSELARDEALSVSGHVACNAAIASKLAPTSIEYICQSQVGRKEPRVYTVKCGSELARDEALSVGCDVACNTAIASKLAPTGIEYICQSQVDRKATAVVN
jgi:hypothetical protein